MKVSRVIIKNFRNLDSFDSLLTDRVAIKGLNHIGKTNILQAIYWVLTDKLIDGSSDIPSIIPHKDRRAVVDVTLVLDDGHEIRKTYCEHWGTTRGSDVEQLTGHDTCYYYDRARITQKYKIQEILNELIRSPLGDKTISNLKLDPKLDINQALINPLYLAKILDWKLFRKFLITLVGDVSNKQVIESHPEFKSLEEPLSQSADSTEFLAKKISDDISTNKVNIASSKQVIDIYKQKEDCKPNELEEANTALEKIAMMRVEIENNKSNVESPHITEAKKKVADIKEQVATLKQAVLEEDNKLYEDYIQKKEKAQTDFGKARALLTQLQTDRESIEMGKSQLNNQLASTDKAIATAEDLLKHYREEFMKIQKEKNSFEPIICEHCGQVANEYEKQQSEEEFKNKQKARLMQMTELGKAQATEVSKLKATKKDLEIKLANSDNSTFAMSLDSQIISASKDLAMKQDILNQLLPQKSSRHKELDELQEDLAEAANELLAAQIVYEEETTVEGRLAKFDEDMKEAKEGANAIIAQHNVYEDAQQQIRATELKLTALNKQQTQLLELKSLLSQFIRVKLEMINSSTKKIFPDIDFVLVEENIKEGSFNEVCYPLIKGRKTPFLDGSGAEKILTGITIVDNIRKALNVEPCPIIFDEGETLDENSLREIATECQVITSIVDDVGDVPTVHQF